MIETISFCPPHIWHLRWHVTCHSHEKNICEVNEYIDIFILFISTENHAPVMSHLIAQSGLRAPSLQPLFLLPLLLPPWKALGCTASVQAVVCLPARLGFPEQNRVWFISMFSRSSTDAEAQWERSCNCAVLFHVWFMPAYSGGLFPPPSIWPICSPKYPHTDTMAEQTESKFWFHNLHWELHIHLAALSYLCQLQTFYPARICGGVEMKWPV